MLRFETQYPVTAREGEIQRILHFVTKGQSCQLISVPGGGRSTVLRLLAFHKALRDFQLQEKEPQYVFVYVNFSELGNFDHGELIKFIFLNLVFRLDADIENAISQDAIDKIEKHFQETLATKDGQLIFQHFKISLELLSQEGLTTVFLLDRFSEYAEKTSDLFFTSLKTLRTATGGKLAFVFSNHRPLESLLTIDYWKNFYEFFIYNQIFLQLKNEQATDFRLSVLEKEYKKTLPEELKKLLYALTGGHSKLMKLTGQLFLSSDYTLPRTKEELIEILLKSVFITTSLVEIWQSLTADEKKLLKRAETTPLLKDLCLPFPLLTEFIRRNLAETLIHKEIRLDTKTNELYYGDEPIEGLTGYEFKLLSYFIANPNRVCERDEIIQAVWQESKTQEGVSDEALDQIMYRLRKKIEDEPDNPRHLVTVKGRGFRFIP